MWSNCQPAGSHRPAAGRTLAPPEERADDVRISLLSLIYLAVGVVVALTNGYNSVAGVSEVLSLIVAVVLWPLVLFGVDLHLPPIAT